MPKTREALQEELDTLLKGPQKGALTESVTFMAKVDEEARKQILSEADKTGDKPKLKLMPKIEAIHAGMTHNFNMYPGAKLRGVPSENTGVYSWTKPYPKPMLKNHDSWSEPTGRIVDAQFITSSSTGKEAIVIIPEITDPDAIEKILDGRYLTVSIGAITNQCICSICGADLMVEGWCGHWKGEKYDDQLCYWICGDLTFIECSWVNVPADEDAHVVDKGSVVQVSEAYAIGTGAMYDITKNPNDEHFHVSPQLSEALSLTSNINTAGQGGKQPVEENKNKTPNSDTTPTATEEIAQLKTRVSELETTNTQLTEQVNTLTASNTESQATIATQKTQLSDKDTELATLKSENDLLKTEKETLVSENADMKSAMHKVVAEQVTDLRISLKRVKASERDSHIESLMARSEESLQNTLADLRQEMGHQITVPAKVENPVDNVAESQDDKNTAQVDPATALKRMFAGRKRN